MVTHYKYIIEAHEGEVRRNLRSRAARNLFQSVYSEHFSGNETVLEVGSGLGFLRRNWPEAFNGEWTQLEADPIFLEEAKEELPEGTYVEANALELPFEDNSFDVVIGLDALDILQNRTGSFDLETAVNEAHRVLKDGGLFFHMRDRSVTEQMVQHLGESQTCWLLPHDKKGYTRAVLYVPKDRLQDFSQEFQHTMGISWEDLRDKEDLSEADEMKANKITLRYVVEVQPYDYFIRQLAQFMTGFDQETIKTGLLTSTFKGKRTGQQKEYCGNMWCSTQTPGIGYTQSERDIRKWGSSFLYNHVISRWSKTPFLEMYRVAYLKARK